VARGGAATGGERDGRGRTNECVCHSAIEDLIFYLAAAVTVREANCLRLSNFVFYFWTQYKGVNIRMYNLFETLHLCYIYATL
jgi:hypothetical protein